MRSGASSRQVRPRREQLDEQPGSRNGEPSEEDPPFNCLLYVIVLGALAMVIGAELVALGFLIFTPKVSYCLDQGPQM